MDTLSLSGLCLCRGSLWNAQDPLGPPPAPEQFLTFVTLFSQSQNSVVDQRKLPVFTDQDPVYKSPVITVVLHKDLTALLTERQAERDRQGVREVPYRL